MGLACDQLFVSRGRGGRAFSRLSLHESSLGGRTGTFVARPVNAAAAAGFRAAGAFLARFFSSSEFVYQPGLFFHYGVAGDRRA